MSTTKDSKTARVQPNLNDVQWEEVVETSDGEKQTSQLNEISDYKVICDLSLLGPALDSCEYCGCRLRLSKCKGMKLCGLGCEIHIPCENGDCLRTNVIPLSKRHKHKKFGPKVWDLNTKAAAG